MSGSAQEELIHKVNNLLAVIYTQAEVGRSQGREHAIDALQQILKAAEATLPFVRRAQAEAEGAGGS